MIGTIVNAGAILLGGALGILLRRKMPQRLISIVMQGIGLATLLVGVQMMIVTKNVLITLFSIIIGGIVGEAINIEGRLEKFGKKLESRFGSDSGNFTKAFVTASLLFCVGPMAIIGSLADGLRGDYAVLLTKSTLDGTVSVVLASTLGIGTIFSAIPIFIYQGGITLAANSIKNFLTDLIINEVTAAGGLLIVGISINLLQIQKVKVGNLLPAIFVAAILAPFFIP